MKKKFKYENEAQQRLIKTILVLFGDVIAGLRPVDIATNVGGSASMVCRDMANLEAAGLVFRIEETGKWCLSPTLPSQAFKVLERLNDAQEKLDLKRSIYTQKS